MRRRYQLLTLLLLLVLTLPAYAYIDPGTGSFVLQLIIGGVAGAFVAFKLFWGRLRTRFRKAPGEPRD